MELAIVIWLACGIGSAIIASNRGESGCLWFGLGVVFGPVGLLISLTTGTRCIYCAKKISEKATICPYCRSAAAIAVNSEQFSWEKYHQAKSAPSLSVRTNLLLAGIVAVGVVVLVIAVMHEHGKETVDSPRTEAVDSPASRTGPVFSRGYDLTEFIHLVGNPDKEKLAISQRKLDYDTAAVEVIATPIAQVGNRPPLWEISQYEDLKTKQPLGEIQASQRLWSTKPR